MKVVMIILSLAVAANAFVMWCVCAAGGREDERMEELEKKERKNHETTDIQH